MLHTLVYASTAARPFDSAQLLDLLVEARSRNERRSITGVLLYDHGHFLQLLEGGQDDVLAVYDSIRRDPRHREVRTLWAAAGANRQFTEWQMAFIDLDDQQIAHPGYASVLAARASIERDPASVDELVQLLGKQLEPQ